MDTAYDNDMVRCVCGSGLVYPAASGTARLITPEGGIVFKKQYKGACTDCALESTTQIGIEEAELSWNKMIRKMKEQEIS